MNETVTYLISCCCENVIEILGALCELVGLVIMPYPEKKFWNVAFSFAFKNMVWKCTTGVSDWMAGVGELYRRTKAKLGINPRFFLVWLPTEKIFYKYVKLFKTESDHWFVYFIYGMVQIQMVLYLGEISKLGLVTVTGWFSQTKMEVKRNQSGKGSSWS